MQPRGLSYIVTLNYFATDISVSCPGTTDVNELIDLPGTAKKLWAVPVKILCGMA